METFTDALLKFPSVYFGIEFSELPFDIGNPQVLHSKQKFTV